MPDVLLDGWMVGCAARALEPVRAAAELLGKLGATLAVAREDERTLRLRGPGGATCVLLEDWTGEGALRARLEHLGEPALVPSGAVLTAYAGLRLAGAALAGDAQISVAVLLDELLRAREVRGRIRPELVRCRDGWGIARWRDQDERDLFRALAGPEGAARLDDVLAETRVARLLFAGVRPPRPWEPLVEHGVLDGTRARVEQPRIVDWTVLWAGPWATEELRAAGADVERIEHPRRRDGLLRSEAGTQWWQELNGTKTLSLLDGRDEHDLARIRAHLESADVLFTSMTPRALHSLGLDDDWRLARAPRLLHVELVAFEEPWSDLPGLGEHAAAEAGLLWRAGAEPAAPYAWADPLLGAGALVLCRAWLAAEERRGGRIRLSLERAASLAFRPTETSVRFVRQHARPTRAARARPGAHTSHPAPGGGR